VLADGNHFFMTHKEVVITSKDFFTCHLKVTMGSEEIITT